MTTSPNATVRALTTYGSDLILGGDFTNLGGPNGDHVASWNGVIYSPLGTGLGGTQVKALVAAQNTLLFGGGTFAVPTSKIAQWNGSVWSALGTGTNGNVNTLLVASSLTLQ